MPTTSGPVRDWPDLQDLEQLAHGVRTGKAFDGIGNGLPRPIVGGGAQGTGALEQAQSEQEFALGGQLGVEAMRSDG